MHALLAAFTGLIFDLAFLHVEFVLRKYKPGKRQARPFIVSYCMRTVRIYICTVFYVRVPKRCTACSHTALYSTVFTLFTVCRRVIVFSVQCWVFKISCSPTIMILIIEASLGAGGEAVWFYTWSQPPGKIDRKQDIYRDKYLGDGLEDDMWKEVVTWQRWR